MGGLNNPYISKIYDCQGIFARLSSLNRIGKKNLQISESLRHQINIYSLSSLHNFSS